MVIEQATTDEFFKSMIDEATSNKDMDEDTLFYIMSLLSSATHSTTFLDCGPDNLMQKPLAFMLKDALEADPYVKYQKLKTLGDFTLVFGGFFREYLNRPRRSDLRDYYDTIGSTAYSSLTDLVVSTKHHPKRIFYELSERFVDYRGLIEEISVSTRPYTKKSISAIVKRYIEDKQDWLGL